MNQSSDDDLMRLVQKGDQAAFKQLMEKHLNAVFGLCMRLTGGNKASAQDFSQDAWLAVLAKCEKYQFENHFKAWLMTITRNLVISEFRRNSRTELMEAEEEEALVSAEDQEAEFLEAEDRARVQKFLDELPGPQRIALVSWLSGNVSYEQIAAEMEIGVGAVKSLIFRAKQDLKAKVGSI